jgi:hypothetical protein
MRFSFKGTSVILYIISFFLPVFVNANIPGFIAFIFGFIYMFSEPVCLVWLANATYLVFIFQRKASSRRKLWLTGMSVFLAVLFPILFWNETFTDGLKGGSYGVGYWFWLTAFILALMEVIKEKQAALVTSR